MAEIFTDKPHPATPRRRQQARAEGHVAKSRDLVSALVMTGSLLALWIGGAGLGEFLTDYTSQQLGTPSWQAFSANAVQENWTQLVTSLGLQLLPVMAMVATVAIVANLAQTGFLFLPQRIAPDFQQIQPSQGIRRITAPSNLFLAPAGLCKTVAVLVVALVGTWSYREDIIALATHSAESMTHVATGILFKISLRIGFTLVLLALVDYLFQRWQHERNLRLTDQEMREELRNSQNDPRIQSQRKTLQHSLAQQKLDQLIASCDLVLFDGKSLAVALQCNPSTQQVPRLVAKGQGKMAEAMITAASSATILLQEERKLSRLLFKKCDRQQSIDPKHFPELARSYHEAAQRDQHAH